MNDSAPSRLAAMAQRATALAHTKPVHLLRDGFWGLALLFLAVAVLSLTPAAWATPDRDVHGQTVPTLEPPALPPAGTPTPTALNLSVVLQRPNAPAPHISWAVPVRVGLYAPGDASRLYYEWRVVLDEGGHWGGTKEIVGGIYDVRVKNLHTLRNVKRSVSLLTDAVLDMGTLKEGDADGDNRVRAADFALLRAVYFTTEGMLGFDPRTDFDEDNRIRASDFALLRSNYFASGDIEVLPAARAGSVGPAGLVALALEPPQVEVLRGHVATLILTAHAGDQAFVAMDAVLHFPPAELQVVDASGQPAGRVEVLSPLSEVFNRADNVTGQVQLGAGVFDDPLTGDVPIARLRFRALPAAQRSQITVVDGTVADPTGKFVTGPFAGAEVIVVATGLPPRYLPLVLHRG